MGGTEPIQPQTQEQPMTTRRTFLNQAALATCALALPITAEPTITGSQSLKAQAHKRGLLVGCAVGAANLHEPDFTQVLIDQYSLVVPENALKFGPPPAIANRIQLCRRRRPRQLRPRPQNQGPRPQLCLARAASHLVRRLRYQRKCEADPHHPHPNRRLALQGEDPELGRRQ
jgi:hypothetical protein